MLAQSGDTLVVWRLDRLGRSLRDLIEWVGYLDEQGVGLQSLHEST
jgi:DNA invertase Pin-like site-specific DNA recombinase